VVLQLRTQHYDKAVTVRHRDIDLPTVLVPLRVLHLGEPTGRLRPQLSNLPEEIRQVLPTKFPLINANLKEKEKDIREFT
jgi:hypothetical protein